LKKYADNPNNNIKCKTYIINECAIFIPDISEILPNKNLLKSQFIVIKYLDTFENFSTLDHSAIKVLEAKNIINVNISANEVCLLKIPIKIQNRIIIIKIG